MRLHLDEKIAETPGSPCALFMSTVPPGNNFRARGICITRGKEFWVPIHHGILSKLLHDASRKSRILGCRCGVVGAVEDTAGVPGSSRCCRVESCRVSAGLVWLGVFGWHVM